MEMIRSSGILMHIASLSGDDGIGTMGREAYRFVDFLSSAGQSYWQILPIGPTGYGDSPYQSFSTYAGNPYFIDLNSLCQEGFLEEADLCNIDWGERDGRIDYEILYHRRRAVFEKAYSRFRLSPPSDFHLFCQEQSEWLEDYALFMAIKDAHGGIPFTKWEEELRTRRPRALAMWRVKLSDQVAYYQMLQYFFYRQWFALKRYANAHGVQIIGDIPIYVAEDSADVWADPKQFQLDAEGHPTEVAGCPPDVFCEDGQLWGNPLYDWSYMRRNKYRWWIKRLQHCQTVYDCVRIDHFRGFESYYAIPYKASNARKGRWKKGPGMTLWKIVRRKLGDLSVIAEDLGFLTPEVREMLKESGFPGMKVLQFAFDPSGESEYLPHCYKQNSVVYTGTHDNDTIKGWFETANEKEQRFAMDYLQAANEEEVPAAMMLAALSSVSNLCILTMQDLLGLGSDGRMNTPSTLGNNWQWRMLPGELTKELSEHLAVYTALYGRAPRIETLSTEG